MNRPHWHLDRECCEKRPPHPILNIRGKIECRGTHLPINWLADQHADIAGARDRQDGNQGDQHQHGARQGVQEELVASVQTTRPAPNTDDEEHWDQNSFKEDVEQDQIKSSKGTDHQGVQHKERNHKFTNALFDAGPSGKNTDRR